MGGRTALLFSKFVWPRVAIQRSFGKEQVSGEWSCHYPDNYALCLRGMDRSQEAELLEGRAKAIRATGDFLAVVGSSGCGKSSLVLAA
jgi:ABC-type uncharacterized transport system fused permease/ATPase subunit